jgi:hypothetical protein
MTTHDKPTRKRPEARVEANVSRGLRDQWHAACESHGTTSSEQLRALMLAQLRRWRVPCDRFDGGAQ